MEEKCCKKSCLCIDGCSLNLIAASMANVFSKYFTCDELDVLAVFFDIFADSLATFAVAEQLNNSCQCRCQHKEKDTENTSFADSTLSVS